MHTTPRKTKPTSQSQFGLLRQRRFGPFFGTQFLGAFNDNVFKTALLIWVAFGTLGASSFGSDTVVNIASGLFILPFFLFSATAGQLADKYDKADLIRWIKVAEIAIMVLAAAAFFFDSLVFLLALLFLMGAQSSFFGPLKYSIIPQHLSAKEIVGGNALVETGTFIAILLGTIMGGILTQVAHAQTATSAALVMVAVAGWLTSRRIPDAPTAAPELTIDLNPFRQTIKTLAAAGRQKPVFAAMLAIGWFWFTGIAYLTQIPNFSRLVLGGAPEVVTLLLAMFSVGIGTGSLLCEKLSGHRVELGLVPVGMLGLSIFGFDLIIALPPQPTDQLLSIGQFIQTTGGIRVLFDLVLMGLCGGLYIVPLYAYVQTRVAAAMRARMIAASNIINAIFMVAASIGGAVLLGGFDLGISRFFMVLAIANGLVGIGCLMRLPEFVLRLISWALTRLMYRIGTGGVDRIPDRGAAVIVCNHVSYVDALLIAGACRRPIRFVMYAPIYRLPLIHLVCRMARVIPIAPRNENPAILRRAYRQINTALRNGEIVCIFPEGRLTDTGELNQFKKGIETIIRTNPVPVIPMALRGMWGSVFSRCQDRSRTARPCRLRSRIALSIGNPLTPDAVTAAVLQTNVAKLRGP